MAKTIKTINFFRYYKILLGTSLLVTIASISMLVMSKLSLGIEFTGGYLIEIQSDSSIDPQEVAGKLKEVGVAVASTQHLSDTRNLQIRISPPQNPISNTTQSQQNTESLAVITNLLHTIDPSITIQRNEFVGASVGSTMKQDGLVAFAISLLAILAYLSFRFNFKMAISAVLSILHDAAMVLFIFMVGGLAFDLNVFAAILAIVGYSLNDNIVIYDRFRSNSTLLTNKKPLDIFNISINQMLRRTILTSVVTLFAVGALYLFGGEVLKFFSLALIAGVIIGTYSTIYIASGLSILFGAEPVIPEAIESKEDHSYYLSKYQSEE